MEGYISEIRMWGPNWAPRNWALCQGQLLPIASNTALFSLIGTIYGGDGRTTFALPDMRGRIPVGTGNGPALTPRVIGQRGGQEDVTLNVAEIPSHNHTAAGTVKAVGAPGNQRIPTNHNLAGTAGDLQYSDAGVNANMAANNVGVTVGNTGGNLSHENMQPWQCVNFVICLQGIFPSRS